MLAEDLEQTAVLVGLQGVHISRHGLCLSAAEHQLTAALVVHTQVKLGDVYVLHNLLKACDGLVELLLAGEVDVIVALHADTVDGYSGILHLLHHIIYTLALALVHAAVVIIDEQHVGVSLACELESLGDELVAAKLEVTALTIGALLLRTARSPAWTAIVGHCLVDHVPAVYYVLIAVHHSMDMLAQTLVEHLFLHLLAFLVGEHPVGKLRVPAEAVAAHLDTVLTAEVGNLVGLLKVPHALLRVQLSGFHVVLGGHAVELFQDEFLLCVVANVALVQCHADSEIVLVGIFQSYVCSWVGTLSELCHY